MEKAKDFSRKTVWPGSTQLAPVPVVLVGSGDGEKYPWNLVTIAWAGTVNSNPPMVSISVRPERHSFPAIRELGSSPSTFRPLRWRRRSTGAGWSPAATTIKSPNSILQP